MDLAPRQRRRLHVSEPCNSGTDIISELSDDILVKILTLLPSKEAGRTSVLSKRWRHTWKYVSELTFHCVSAPRNSGFASSCDHCPFLYSMQALSLKRDHLHKFVLDAENWVCRHHLPPLLSVVSTNFSIKVLELRLERYSKLPSCLFLCRTLQSLEISGFYRLAMPKGFEGFPNLTSLGLHNFPTIGDINYVVSKCPALKRLSLFPRCRQKSRIWIDSCNLRELIIGGGFGDFRLINTPRLVDLDFSPVHYFPELYLIYDSDNGASTLENLKLNNFVMEYVVSNMTLQNLQVLLNCVKMLDVVHDLRDVTSLSTLHHVLQCSSAVKTLVIRLLYRDDCSTVKNSILMLKDMKCSFLSLYCIKITGMTLLSYQMELVLFLLRSSPFLEMLMIEPHPGRLGKEARKTIPELKHFTKADIIIA